METYGADGAAGDFDIAVSFASIDNKTAILMGGAMERKGAKLTRAHRDAAVKAVEEKTGLIADWFRKRDLKT